MIEALVLSNLFLLAIIGIPLLAVLAYITEEVGGALTTLVLIIALIGIYFMSSFNIFYFTYINFTVVVFWLLGYLMVGVLYSFGKWYLDVLKKKESGLDKKYVQIDYSKLSAWIVYWPLSLFWTLLSDVLTRILNRIIDLFGNVYTKIVDYVYRDVKDEK